MQRAAPVPLPPVSRTDREILAELEADPDLRKWHEELDRQETTMSAQSRPACPICGAPMRRYGRGATLRKHGPEFVCPVAEAEEYEDERGHIKRRADARHDRVRFYSGDQLDRPATDAAPPVQVIRSGHGAKVSNSPPLKIPLPQSG